jgi:hypothetical protein
MEYKYELYECFIVSERLQSKSLQHTLFQNSGIIPEKWSVIHFIVFIRNFQLISFHLFICLTTARHGQLQPSTKNSGTI